MSVNVRSNLPRPRLRRGRISGSNTGQTEVKESPTDADDSIDDKATPDGNDKNEEATKFGTVRVYAAVLSQAVDLKTYVITNKTTCRDLVSIVISGYTVTCESSDLFYLSLERKHRGRYESLPVDSPRFVKLDDNTKLLELQSRYPRGETRFCLQMTSEAGKITIRDRCIHPHRPSHSVFVTKDATCRQILELLLKTNRSLRTLEDYRLYEVDGSSKASSELELSTSPLGRQVQWLDPHEGFFEIRLKSGGASTAKQIRRTRSLEEVPANRKLLNIREVRKNLIQHNLRRKPKGTDDSRQEVTCQDGGSRGTTMSRLRESLTQLRDHLEGKQSQGRESPSSESSRDQEDTSQATTRSTNRRTRSLSRDKRRGLRTQETRGRTRRNSDQPLDTSESLLDLLASSRTKRSETSGSNESLSAWERRKMYDCQRRQSGEVAAEPEVRSRKSSASSSASSKSRSRRSLPRIPPATDIGERKKQITQKAVEKIRKAGAKYAAETSSIKSENSLFDLDSDPEYGINGEHINVQSIEDSALLLASAGSSQVVHTSTPRDPDTPRETGFKPLHPHPVTEPRPLTPPGDKAAVHNGVGDNDGYCALPNGHDPPQIKTPDIADQNAVNGDSVGYNQTARLSLHTLLRTCDVHYVTLDAVTPGDTRHARGLTLYESVLTEFGTTQNSELSPPPKFICGRRPILGQNGSAFVRIKPTDQDMQCQPQSLVTMTTVRSIERTVTSESEGNIVEGDYVIEVGGIDVLRHSVHDVITLVNQWHGPLDLVLAKPRAARVGEKETNDLHSLRIELEKCKIKQDSALLEAERYMDMLAGLRLELLSRDDVIQRLQSDLVECHGRLKSQDYNNLTNMNQDSNGKEHRIKQLDCLIVKQTDGYHQQQQRTSGYMEYDYEGSRISAV